MQDAFSLNTIWTILCFIAGPLIEELVNHTAGKSSLFDGRDHRDVTIFIDAKTQLQISTWRVPSAPAGVHITGSVPPSGSHATVFRHFPLSLIVLP